MLATFNQTNYHFKGIMMKKLGIILIAAIALLGCDDLSLGSDTDGNDKNINDNSSTLQPANSNTDLTDLVDKTWSLSSYSNAAGEVNNVIDNTVYQLTFSAEDSTVFGSIDCNTFNSQYHVDEANLSINNVAITEIACAIFSNSSPTLLAKYQQQNIFIINVLDTVNSFSITDGELTLNAPNGDTLRYSLNNTNNQQEPSVINGLDNTQWFLHHYTNTDGELLPPPTSNYTLNLTQADVVSGDVGCSQFSGYPVIDETRFSITSFELITLEIICADTYEKSDEFIAQYQQKNMQIVKLLQDTERYTLIDNELTIYTAEGGKLIYRQGAPTILTNTKWGLTAYGTMDNDVATLTTLLDNTNYSLRFDTTELSSSADDGTGFVGSYTLGTNNAITITIEAWAVHDACVGETCIQSPYAGTEQYNKQNAFINMVLENAATITVSNNTLTLYTQDKKHLVYKAKH